MKYQHSVRRLPGTPSEKEERRNHLCLGETRTCLPLSFEWQSSFSMYLPDQGSVCREGSLVEVDASGNIVLGGIDFVRFCFLLIEV